MSASRTGRCPMLLLMRLLLQACVAATSSLSASINVVPLDLRDIVQNENSTATVSLHIPTYVFRDNATGPALALQTRSLNPGIASVVEGDFQVLDRADFTLDPLTEGTYHANKSVVIRGEFLGKTRLVFRFVSAEQHRSPRGNTSFHKPAKEEEEIVAETTAEAWVKRGGDAASLNRVFVGTLIVLIAIANVLMGCELNLDVVLETVRRPLAPAIGLVTQFLVMPLLAYSIAQIVFVPHHLYGYALGLLVTGCAPGGGASNFWTILLDGNANLSVTMTFLSTLASLAMMPAWLWAVGGEFVHGVDATSQLRTPYAKIISSLVTLVGPLLVGVFIQKRFPQLAARARPLMRPFLLFVLVFVVVFGILANLYMLQLLTWRVLFGGLLLPWCGFGCGCFAALLWGRPPADVTAIAIETGIQNTGVAILLLKFSFGEPTADLASLVPVVVACFTPFPLLLGYGVHSVMQYRKRRTAGNAQEYLRAQCETGPRPLLLPPDSAELLDDVKKGGARMEASVDGSIGVELVPPSFTHTDDSHSSTSHSNSTDSSLATV